MPRKGAKGRTQVSQLRSTEAKARTRVGRQPRADLEQRLDECRRELSQRAAALQECWTGCSQPRRAFAWPNPDSSSGCTTASAE